jgi:hypothetical protein
MDISVFSLLARAQQRWPHTPAIADAVLCVRS